MKAKLIAFLKENNALEMYEYNLMLGGGECTLAERYKAMPPNLAINVAFYWRKGKGNVRLWRKLESEWQKRIVDI